MLNPQYYEGYTGSILAELRTLLIRAKSSIGEERKACIKNAMNMIWDDDTLQDEDLSDLLSDIAYILEDYEPNEPWRKESPSYYGDGRLEQEIESALKKLEAYVEGDSATNQNHHYTNP